jgi:hypothetical protein
MRVAARRGATSVLVVCREVPDVGRSSIADGTVSVVHTTAEPVDQQSTPFAVAFLESCLATVTPEEVFAVMRANVERVRGVIVDAVSAGIPQQDPST